MYLLTWYWFVSNWQLNSFSYWAFWVNYFIEANIFKTWKVDNLVFAVVQSSDRTIAFKGHEQRCSMVWWIFLVDLLSDFNCLSFSSRFNAHSFDWFLLFVDRLVKLHTRILTWISWLINNLGWHWHVWGWSFTRRLNAMCNLRTWLRFWVSELAHVVCCLYCLLYGIFIIWH